MRTEAQGFGGELHAEKGAGQVGDEDFMPPALVNHDRTGFIQPRIAAEEDEDGSALEPRLRPLDLQARQPHLLLPVEFSLPKGFDRLHEEIRNLVLQLLFRNDDKLPGLGIAPGRSPPGGLDDFLNGFIRDRVGSILDKLGE